MRKSLAFAGLILATAGCGGPEPRSGDSPSSSSSNATATADMSAGSSAPAPGGSANRGAAAGPDVAPTAAPGVAFNYRYSFRLEADRVAAVQERHAALCESLGVNRCRITGMYYRVRNERDIEARLSFKLEPAIARRFGREGVGIVTQSDGMLVESEISGTDVAPTIQQAGRGIDQMQEDLRRIEARLAGRLSVGERESLEYEAQQLRASIRAAQDTREGAEESLARTPMTFAYGSGDLVPGSDNRRPVRDALRRAGDNFVDGVTFLFILVVTLLPWALAGLLISLAVRAIRRRRWFGASRPSAGAEPHVSQGTTAA